MRLLQVLLLCISVTVISTAYGQIIVDNKSATEVTANVGEDVTLICDLRNVGNEDIYWYAVELRDYISRNENIVEDNLPESDVNYFSIGYDETAEQFNLTIRNVRIRDSRTYECVHYTGVFSKNKNPLIKTKLTVLSAPSADSPVCKVLPTQGTSVEAFNVGDTVRFECSADGGSPIPQLIWYRSWYRYNSNQVLVEGPGYITELHKLTRSDTNVVFTCFMTTPALDLSRNCSVIPLKSSNIIIDPILTVPNIRTTSSPSTTNTVPSGKQTQHIGTGIGTTITETRSSVSNQGKMQNLVIIATGAGAVFIFLVIILAIIIAVICCWRKKRAKDSPEPRHRPTTGVYELVTHQDADSGVAREKSSQQEDNLYADTPTRVPITQPLNQSTENNKSRDLDEITQPRTPDPSKHYNKNSRVNYVNVVNEDEHQLVYAELELNEDAGDEIIQTDKPTLYAEVIL